jgi:hypothetical protein
MGIYEVRLPPIAEVRLLPTAELRSPPKTSGHLGQAGSGWIFVLFELLDFFRLRALDTPAGRQTAAPFSTQADWAIIR